MRSQRLNARFIESDFRKINYRTLDKFNIYLFDGPHTEDDHRDGIVLAQSALDDDFFLIIDDWNWRPVRIGTMRGLLDAKCKIRAAIELRTAPNDQRPQAARQDSNWHNGYFLALASKV